jgi:signal peptidase I
MHGMSLNLEHPREPSPGPGRDDAARPGARAAGSKEGPVGDSRGRTRGETGAKAASQAGKKAGALRAAVEVVVIVAAAFVVALLVQAFLVKPFTIHQVSMRPTLEEGDRILLNRLTYHFRDPARGDIVVFRSPIAPGEDLVKRIVAISGDRVAVTGGRLWVNGAVQYEPYLLNQTFRGEMRETVVPAGHVFVMGDNRDNSGDSRVFGPIDTRTIIGTAFLVYWPIRHCKTL